MPLQQTVETLSGQDKAIAAKLWTFQKTLRKAHKDSSQPISFSIEDGNGRNTSHRLIYQPSGDFNFAPAKRPEQLPLSDVLEILSIFQYYQAPITRIIEQAIYNPELSHWRNSFYGISVHGFKPVETNQLLDEVVADHLTKAVAKSDEAYRLLRKLQSENTPLEDIRARAQEPIIGIAESVGRARLVRTMATLEEGRHNILLLNPEIPPIRLKRVVV